MKRKVKKRSIAMMKIYQTYNDIKEPILDKMSNIVMDTHHLLSTGAHYDMNHRTNCTLCAKLDCCAEYNQGRSIIEVL